MCVFLFERMGEKIECEGSVVDKDQRDKENNTTFQQSKGR